MTRQKSIKPAFESLDTIEDFLWTHLELGRVKGSHGWHCGALATIADDRPSVRIVVLRGVNRDRGILTFHTDNRAPKYQEIKKNPRVSWVFYDSDRAVQLRVTGLAIPATDADAAAVWESMPDRCIRSYATIQPPGDRQDEGVSGLPPGWESGEPPRDECAWTLDHFSVIRVTIDSLDFLHLRAAGHQRARFHRINSTTWEPHWVTP